MSIPREYARALRQNLRARAVWPPTQAIAPGDYGVFVGGVFSRLGNITTDFGVPYVVESGGHKADRFQYHSERTTSVEGNLGMTMLGAEAELSISLESKSSFFVSVAEFDLERLQSPRAVATRLRETPGWRCLRYFVVWELYKGYDLLFYGSESGGAAVKIRGSNEDVKLLAGAGKLGGSLQIGTSGDVGIQIRGSADTVATFGINLFRVKLVGDTLALSFGVGDAAADEQEPHELLADHDAEDDPEDIPDGSAD